MGPGAYRLVKRPNTANLLARFFGRFRRVGLRGVLADANRGGIRTDVPGAAATMGMTWQRRDRDTRRWYPQGITTSADAYGPDSASGEFERRPVIVVSWYAHSWWGWLMLGSRISVIDYSDAAAPRYRHVRLVEPKRRWGFNALRPVRVHAGGIVWYGNYLYVAGSGSGVRVFRLADIIRVRNRVRTLGYRYVLPQFTRYAAENEAGVEPMTYSFMSLDRAGDVDHLVVGEYGRKGGNHRLMRYPLDRDTQLLTSDDLGRATPAHFFDEQIERMQGATIVNGTWAITSSMGEGNPGDLWVGRPGNYVRHRAVLPTGAEDITHWPQRRQLWSVTEWPGRRWVYAIDTDPWVEMPTR